MKIEFLICSIGHIIDQFERTDREEELASKSVCKVLPNARTSEGERFHLQSDAENKKYIPRQYIHNVCFIQEHGEYNV